MDRKNIFIVSMTIDTHISITYKSLFFAQKLNECNCVPAANELVVIVDDC